jgi:GAF domain-containing protein
MNDYTTSPTKPTLPAADPMNQLRLEAARKRLAESRGEEDAIEGLREIVANFLGSEEVALFRLDRATAGFQVYWSFGIDPEGYDLRRALGEAGHRRLMGGECHVAFAAGEGSGATTSAQAFIPIRFANQTLAILAILRLLPQKLAFESSDMELLQLLSDEAGRALFGRDACPTPERQGA